MAAEEPAGTGPPGQSAPLLRTLIADHGAEIRRLCRLYVGPEDAEDAEDAAQDVLLAVVRRLWQLEDGDRALGWLRVLTFHRCLDFRRRRARRRRLEVAPGDEDWRALAGCVAGDDADLAELVEGRRLRELVASHLDRMPPAFGVMLRLRRLEGMSQSEIAAMTGVAVGTSSGGCTTPVRCSWPPSPSPSEIRPPGTGGGRGGQIDEPEPEPGPLLLRGIKEEATTASLTGALEGGHALMAQVFNRCRQALVEAGDEGVTALFPELTDQASVDDIGVAAALLLRYAGAPADGAPHPAPEEKGLAPA